MKIGILTFLRVINYGAVLQAYALNKKIRTLGYECEDIDYTSKEISDFYKPYKIKKISDIKDVLYHLFTWRRKQATKKKFFDFINNYIPVSSINYDNHVSDLNGKYDILVCGSDQIWNYDLTGSDSNYYLSFDNKAKKVSYAGSFGKLKLNNKERSDAIKYLEKFAHISVRESSGKEIIDSLFNMQLAKVVLDPVFLLDKSEWQSIANKPEYNDYILLFLLHKNPNLLEFSKKLAKRKGCKIIRITNNITFDKEIIYLAGCGPKDFIGLIDNAQYVITDSFHATSMSLILNKQFFVGLKGKELENLNTRMFSLLEMFGFSQRIVGSYSFDENNEIDFSSTNEILDNKRKESIQYLDNIIMI